MHKTMQLFVRFEIVAKSFENILIVGRLYAKYYFGFECDDECILVQKKRTLKFICG